jgi:hypothetical protein
VSQIVAAMTAKRLLQLYQRHAAEPEPLPEDLEGLIGELRGLQEERRRRAMSTILAYGATGVPALEAALASTSSSLVQERIIHLLAMIGEVQQIGAVWDA